MTDESNAENEAKAQAESIAAMVAALECDYDRLEELIDERDNLVSDCDGKRLSELRVARMNYADSQLGNLSSLEVHRIAWDQENPDEAEEIETLQAAEDALNEWDEENREELAELKAAAGDCTSSEEANQRILDDALEVQVRSGWVTPGQDETGSYDEFEILLCTGGPAVRIMGRLTNNQPSRAWLEYQDWGTPWTQAYNVIERETLLTYCQQFYFGD